MKTIYLAKITTLIFLSASTLFSQEVKESESTFSALVEEQSVETKEAVSQEVVEPAKAPQEEVIVKTAEVNTVETQEVTKNDVVTPTQEVAVDKVPATIEPKEEVVEAVSKQAPKETNVAHVPSVKDNEIVVVLPPVPTAIPVAVVVPKLLVLDSEGNLVEEKNAQLYYPEKKVTFSKNVAPARFNVDRGHKKVEALEGDIKDGRVAAYLHTDIISVDEVKEKLEKAGFEVLSTFKIDKKGTVTSIVFTNDAMTKSASQSKRGFAASLRVTVDKKDKTLVISNPIYMMRAFMQKTYDKELAQTTLKSLRDAFPNVKNSQEIVKFRVLERFQFMENMPFYQDMKLVSQGKNEALLAKAKKSKKLVFEQHLGNGSILIGVKLGKRTTKFVKKIGYENAGLLPYPVLIEKGKAYMLAPQYYIAVMYPKLKMSQFMKIATVPGAIAKDIDRVFR